MESKPENGPKSTRKPPVKWRDKPTHEMIIHVQDHICNPYIRLRDESCFGKSISDNGRISDAGHYFSVGSRPAMRFNPQNIHGQSKSGNMFKSGDLLNYRKGLIDRHGLQYVEELESQSNTNRGVKSLDRISVIIIAETYLYLLKTKTWVFRQSDFLKFADFITIKPI